LSRNVGEAFITSSKWRYSMQFLRTPEQDSSICLRQSHVRQTRSGEIVCLCHKPSLRPARVHILCPHMTRASFSSQVLDWEDPFSCTPSWYRERISFARVCPSSEPAAGPETRQRGQI
jgi:hypothetical protein